MPFILPADIAFFAANPASADSMLTTCNSKSPESGGTGVASSTNADIKAKTLHGHPYGFGFPEGPFCLSHIDVANWFRSNK